MPACLWYGEDLPYGEHMALDAPFLRHSVWLCLVAARAMRRCVIACSGKV